MDFTIPIGGQISPGYARFWAVFPDFRPPVGISASSGRPGREPTPTTRPTVRAAHGGRSRKGACRRRLRPLRPIWFPGPFFKPMELDCDGKHNTHQWAYFRELCSDLGFLSGFWPIYGYFGERRPVREGIRRSVLPPRTGPPIGAGYEKPHVDVVSESFALGPAAARRRGHRPLTAPGL